MTIKPEQIPTAAMTAFCDKFYKSADLEQCVAAAINAWPHAHHVNHHEWMKTGELASFDVVLPVILPMPQEKNND